MELTGGKIGTQHPTNLILVSCKSYSRLMLTPRTDQTAEGGPRRMRRHLSAAEADEYLNAPDTWRLQIIK